MGLTQISTQGIKDGTISSADLADQSVTLAKLPHGTSSNDGKFLRANNGADPTFETVSSIGGSTGVDFDDNVKARFGTGNDLQIYHDGTNSHIKNATGALSIKGSQVSFDSADGSEYMIKAVQNGAAELYHNGSKKFETISNGCTITGRLNVTDTVNPVQINLTDNRKIKLGDSDDLQIYHDGTHSHINNATNDLTIECTTNDAALTLKSNNINLKDENNQFFLKGIENTGAVELYYGNSLKFKTDSIGCEIAGALIIPDGSASSNRISVGNAGDLKIYHNGSHSFIEESGTGNLTIKGSSQININNAADTENCAIFKTDGEVELYFDGSKKFSTKSFGIDIYGQLQLQGHCTPSANNTYDLGTTSERWRNVYTNDLNLSNEGGANDVDSTWGSFTIQEGAEDLFLINRRNGKKYKFNLTEVS